MSAFHFSIKLDSSVTHLRAFTATKLTAFGVKPGAADSTTSIIQKWESTSAIDPHSFADMDDEAGYSYFENEIDDAFNSSIFTQSQYVDYFPENAIYNQHKAALFKLFYDREIQLLNPITMLPLDFSTPNVETDSRASINAAQNGSFSVNKFVDQQQVRAGGMASPPITTVKPNPSVPDANQS